jgi:hypothetical protein
MNIFPVRCIATGTVAAQSRALRPQFLIVDGTPGLEKALAAVWEGTGTAMHRAQTQESALPTRPSGGSRFLLAWPHRSCRYNRRLPLHAGVLKDPPGFFIPCFNSRQKFKLLCELIAAGKSQPTSLHF